jgi:hypothetical protein
MCLGTAAVYPSHPSMLEMTVGHGATVAIGIGLPAVAVASDGVVADSRRR